MGSLTYITRALVSVTSVSNPARSLLQCLQFVPLHGTSPNISKRNFKSEIHTNNLYPGSKVTDRFTLVEPETLANTSSSLFNGIIPVKELDIKYSGSSAPGGQNVNKSATKVEARFKLDSATWLSDETKEILIEKWQGQLTKDGYFVVKSERTRSQILNQADVLAKLRHSIWKALEEHLTRIETQQVDEVEAERQRKLQVKAARERVKQKRIASQMQKDKKSYDEWQN